jgi:hypothetical protein
LGRLRKTAFEKDTQELQDRNTAARLEIEELAEKNRKLGLENGSLRRVKSMIEKGTDGDAVAAVLQFRYPRRWPSTYAVDAAESIVSCKVPALREALVKTVSEAERARNPLTDPAAVAKAMDLAGGVLNHSGLDVLRKAVSLGGGDTSGSETEADVKPEVGGSWLASNRQVLGVMKRVEKAAEEEVCPFEVTFVDGKDGVKFNYQKLLSFVLEIYGLDEIARTTGGVKIAITLDGAELSRNAGHVTAGVKITDPRAIDPITRLPIGVFGAAKVQSRELCIPFKIVTVRHPVRCGGISAFHSWHRKHENLSSNGRHWHIDYQVGQDNSGG